MSKRFLRDEHRSQQDWQPTKYHRDQRNYRGHSRGYRGYDRGYDRIPGHVHTDQPFPLTYRISGWAGLVHDELRRILDSVGFREVQSDHGVGFLLLEFDNTTSRLDKHCSALHVSLKNILSNSKTEIVAKDRLYENMKKAFPELTQRYMANTFPLQPNTCLFPSSSSETSSSSSETPESSAESSETSSSSSSSSTQTSSSNISTSETSSSENSSSSTISTTETSSSLSSSVFIVRPVGNMACSGRGISIVTNDAELLAARALVKDYSRAIVSDYFPQPPEAPLLWNGRKFHLRMYLLVRAAHGSVPYHCEMWTRGKILTALKPYEPGNWHDKEIHDTHGATTPYNLWFPEDLPVVEDRHAIFAGIREVGNAVGRILQPLAAPYPESRAAYEVFGCDFLVGRDNRVVLLEINDRVGFGFRTIRDVYENPHEITRAYYRNGAYNYADFSADFYAWIYRTAIQPIFNTPQLPGEPQTFGISTKPVD